MLPLLDAIGKKLLPITASVCKNVLPFMDAYYLFHWLTDKGLCLKGVLYLIKNAEYVVTFIQ